MAAKPASKPAGATVAPHKALIPQLQDVKPLTIDEAQGMRDGLILGFGFAYQGIDAGISWTNKAKKEAVIWTLMSDDDTEFIVDAILNAGMRVPAVAVAVRGMDTLMQQYRIGAILLPKFAQTWMFYASNGGFALPFGR